MTIYPNVFSISDLKIGYKERFIFQIDEKMMLDFEKISGDSNPLHVNSSFAISRGYHGKVVYGALLIAKVSKMLGMKLPGRDSVWTNASISFLKPLYVGEEAELLAEINHVSKSTSSVELLIKIFSIKEKTLKVRGKVNTLITNFINKK